MENTTTLNREGWLTAFAEAVAPIIEKRTGLKVPMKRIRLSCSFPKGRATPNRKGTYTTGQCFHGDTHKSGIHELFINPLRDEVVNDEGHGVGETIIHEMLHASLEKGVGHKAPFARAAKAMGLEGKPTATIAGPEAVKLIREIAKPLGPYPHKALDGEWGRKQGTRLLKVMCTDCGYINEAGNGYTIRVTMTWIENAGLPICPCGATMSLMDKDTEVPIIALKPVESSAHYEVPFVDDDGRPFGVDPRFQIRRTTSEHHGDRWAVIDFGAPEVREHEVQGEVQKVAVVQFDQQARIVAAEGKTDALDMISAIREGLYTWDDLEKGHEDGWIEDEDDGTNPLADEDPDLDALLYVADDEDETPDHPEDQQPEAHIVRMRRGGEWVERELSFDYDAVASSREG